MGNEEPDGVTGATITGSSFWLWNRIIVRFPREGMGAHTETGTSVGVSAERRLSSFMMVRRPVEEAGGTGDEETLKSPGAT